MLRSSLLPVTRKHFQVTSIRNKQKKVPKVDKKLQATTESLAARGFLRPNKPWDPPADIDKQIIQICSKNGLGTNSEFESIEKKYVVLKSCFEETGHGVPNSLLHTIETVEDLMEFYGTSVDNLTPFDSLKKMELPKNLHVQENYVRFHPDTDTLFNGKSAFPQSSTIVTGLKARTKYAGYTAKRKWP